MDDIQAMVDQAYEPENAIKILTNILKRPGSRGDGKSTITAITDAAICRAIVALKKDVMGVRHGEWVESDIPCERYICSVCGGACWYYDHGGEVAKSAYCPNCGTKMDGGNTDDQP